ncbi:MAG: hypothetical protein PHH00_04020 [Candidatus Nanoarchaeia archaeon]|nr:hypothetical protein [Candidatus Nanoarchaeia archaeon]
MNKIRINITVDSKNIERAKTKLKLFGGKLSTLFDAYLEDFVSTMEKEPYENLKDRDRKIKELEERIERLEKKIK